MAKEPITLVYNAVLCLYSKSSEFAGLVHSVYEVDDKKRLAVVYRGDRMHVSSMFDNDTFLHTRVTGQPVALEAWLAQSNLRSIEWVGVIDLTKETMKMLCPSIESIRTALVLDRSVPVLPTVARYIQSIGENHNFLSKMFMDDDDDEWLINTVLGDSRRECMRGHVYNMTERITEMNRLGSDHITCGNKECDQIIPRKVLIHIADQLPVSSVMVL